MAAFDQIEILVKDKDGHGAHPNQTIGPILLGGHIVTAWQSIVLRAINPQYSAGLWRNCPSKVLNDLCLDHKQS